MIKGESPIASDFFFKLSKESSFSYYRLGDSNENITITICNRQCNIHDLFMHSNRLIWNETEMKPRFLG